jgi:hypothetical protein
MYTHYTHVCLNALCCRLRGWSRSAGAIAAASAKNYEDPLQFWQRLSWEEEDALSLFKLARAGLVEIRG